MIQHLALRQLGQHSLAELLRLESLVDHLQGVADHVVLLAQGPEASEDLVIDSLGQQDLVEWIKLLYLG